jgi:hypothetical protein
MGDVPHFSKNKTHRRVARPGLEKFGLSLDVLSRDKTT